MAYPPFEAARARKSGANPYALTNDQNDELVSYAQQSAEYLRGTLDTQHRRAADGWRAYFGIREDRRDPINESWRAFISIPQIMYNTEAKVAQQVEILFSSDPPIQPDPIRASQDQSAKGISDLLEYTMRTNQMRKLMGATFRAASIQGTEFLKTVWKRRTIQVMSRASEQQVVDFQKALEDAVGVLALAEGVMPDWQQDPRAFEAWRTVANKTGKVQIPAAPDLSGQPREIIRFLGPYVERVPFWQLLIDPLVAELADQPIIIHEIWQSQSWVRARTGPGTDKPYDPVRVEEAISAVQGERATQEQNALRSDLGIPDGIGNNPQFAQPCVIWEVWRLNSEFPYQVILNKKAVINKNPRVVPFEHGMAPFAGIRNIYVPGYAFGFSDAQASASLAEEQSTLRDLRLDKVTLHTLPIFQKRAGMGMPDLQKRLRPGGFVEVQQIDGIKPLIPGEMNPSAFAEGDRISMDIDRSYGIGENVRGGQATVGRVPATTDSNRLNQALTRIKMSVIQAEDDSAPMIQQWLGLWAQYGDTESRPTAGGYDPMANLQREQLLVALAQDYRLRGATQAIAPELKAQQMIMFGDKFANILIPPEIRQLAKEVAETLNMRNVEAIITPQGTALLTKQYAAQQAQAASANQAAKQQTDGVNAAAEAPTEVEVDPGATGGGPQ